MSVNVNSLFATNPHANIRRSRFDMSARHTTSFDSWQIIPAFWCEILPADTFSVTTSVCARLQTLKSPIYGDIYLDCDWFFVPNRLIWKNWTRFLGDNPDPWFEDYDVDTPQINIDFAGYSSTKSVKAKTVADYLGCPVVESGSADATSMDSITHLPFRAYSLIYNEWWRSENVDNMTAFNNEDNSVDMNSAGAPFYGGDPLIANKFADLWTRALPAPQKGDPVYVGLETLAPVVTRSAQVSNPNLISMHWQSTNSSTEFNGGSHYDLRGYGVHHSDTETNDHLETYGVVRSDTGSVTGRLFPSNLYADLSSASGVSINALRTAFATQRYLETLARSGSRYIEYLESIWGTNPGDARLQRSEFLGGSRTRINVNQTVSQAATSDADLGDVGAYSLTTDSNKSFTKSFTEHGILMCLVTARWKSQYQNGYDPKWFRKGVYSYYNPVFANIGEQPIKNKSIFASGGPLDNDTFGFQEAWCEYRYSQDFVSSEMRSSYPQSLDLWHLADDYSELPSLSSEWLKGDKHILDRALAVTSDVSNQIFADFYFKIDATRAMPMRSIPGLSAL